MILRLPFFGTKNWQAENTKSKSKTIQIIWRLNDYHRKFFLLTFLMTRAVFLVAKIVSKSLHGSVAEIPDSFLFITICFPSQSNMNQ